MVGGPDGSLVVARPRRRTAVPPLAAREVLLTPVGLVAVQDAHQEDQEDQEEE